MPDDAVFAFSSCPATSRMLFVGENDSSEDKGFEDTASIRDTPITTSIFIVIIILQ